MTSAGYAYAGIGGVLDWFKATIWNNAIKFVTGNLVKEYHHGCCVFDFIYWHFVLCSILTHRCTWSGWRETKAYAKVQRRRSIVEELNEKYEFKSIWENILTAWYKLNTENMICSILIVDKDITWQWCYQTRWNLAIYLRNQVDILFIDYNLFSAFLSLP